MLQVREGNREAANMLYRRNRQRIAGYITRIMGRSRAVEDLTQDVFLQAITHADQYRPTAKVTTWLYRIATNLSLNYMKRADVKRQAAQPEDAPLEVVDRRSEAPDQQMSLDEVRSRVNEALQSLPVNQRIALTLFEYEQCSYEQIAAVLETTVEAVRSLLGRARTTMRRNLQGLL